MWILFHLVFVHVYIFINFARGQSVKEEIVILPVSNGHDNTDKRTFQATLCLVQCIQTMQQMDMQIADPRILDRNFGSWINGPYSVFLFEAMCGTYSHHKQCLLDCPDSKSKQTTLQSLAPLDYACIDHYNEFSKHLPCYMKLKTKLQETCNSKCGSEEQMVADVKQIQASNETGDEQIWSALNKMCSFAICKKSCYAPLVLQTCGDDASAVVHHFTAFTAAQFIKEMDTAGFNQLPSTCQELAIDDTRAISASSSKEQPTTTLRMIIFDSSLAEEENLTAITDRNLHNSTFSGSNDRVDYSYVTAFPNAGKFIYTKPIICAIGIVITLLTVIISVCVLRIIIRNSQKVHKGSPVRKAWIKMQGFVNTKNKPSSGVVLSC